MLTASQSVFYLLRSRRSRSWAIIFRIVWVSFFCSQKQSFLSGIRSSSLGCRRWFWDTNVSALLLTHFSTFGSCFSSFSHKCCLEITVKQKYPCVHGLPECTTASHYSSLKLNCFVFSYVSHLKYMIVCSTILCYKFSPITGLHLCTVPKRAPHFVTVLLRSVSQFSTIDICAVCKLQLLSIVMATRCAITLWASALLS